MPDYNYKHNPHDEHAARSKHFTMVVNDYDLFEIARQANGDSKSAFVRRVLCLPDVRMGAPKGSKNAKKK